MFAIPALLGAAALGGVLWRWRSREPAARAGLLPASIALLLVGPVCAIGVQAWLLHSSYSTIPMSRPDSASLARWVGMEATGAGLLASLVLLASAIVLLRILNGLPAAEGGSGDGGAEISPSRGLVASALAFGTLVLAIVVVWCGSVSILSLTRFLIGSRVSNSSAIWEFHKLLQSVPREASGRIDVAGAMASTATFAIWLSVGAVAGLMLAALAGWMAESAAPVRGSAVRQLRIALGGLRAAAAINAIYLAAVLVRILTL